MDDITLANEAYEKLNASIFRAREFVFCAFKVASDKKEIGDDMMRPLFVATSYLVIDKMVNLVAWTRPNLSSSMYVVFEVTKSRAGRRLLVHL